MLLARISPSLSLRRYERGRVYIYIYSRLLGKEGVVVVAMAVAGRDGGPRRREAAQTCPGVMPWCDSFACFGKEGFGNIGTPVG